MATTDIVMNICIIEKCRNPVNLTNEDPQKPSPDYESIHETEIDASSSAATTGEKAATNEDAYSALKERIATVHEQPVYCALDVSRCHVVDHPDEVSHTIPVYVNIAKR